MSNAKLAAFAAALVMAVASNASAQSAQPVHAALKAPPHMTRTRLVAWCKSHPAATADCKDVRGDTREVRADRKEVRADHREVKSDLKAGEKREAKRDARELKADRKDLHRDTKDRHSDVRDVRKDARKDGRK
jgi:seryl-tRNA synthetase